MILADTSSLMISNTMALTSETKGRTAMTLNMDLIRHIFLNTTLNIRKKFGKNHRLVFACDSNNYWRRDLYPHYKGNRKAGRESSSFDWTTFFECFDQLKEEIRTYFPYRVIEIPRLEADDIIGHLAMTATEETIIYSSDEDFIQCLRNPRVKLYFPVKKKFQEPMNAFEVEKALFEKICQGDGGDFICNIFSPNTSLYEKVRQKSCRADVVSEFFSKGVPDEYKKRFEENRKLIDLRETPEEYKAQIEAAMSAPIQGSMAKVFSYLQNKDSRVKFLKDAHLF